MTEQFQLLPEWAPQEAVLLVWPDNDTDWQPWLAEVQNVYLDIIAKLNRNNTPVILLVRENSLAACQSRLQTSAKVVLVKADFNDTWIRDYGFLSIKKDAEIFPIEFNFNGWGQKFNASKDN